MRLWPARVAQWREPEAFRIEQDARFAREMPPWLRPLFVLIFSAMFMLGWGVAHMNPHKQVMKLAAALPFSVVASFVIVYGLLALLRWMPSSITFYDRAIMKSGWQHMRLLKSWTGFAWRCEGSYYVLELINAKGARWRFGISDPALREKILPVLRQNGLTEIASDQVPPRGA